MKYRYFKINTPYGEMYQLEKKFLWFWILEKFFIEKDENINVKVMVYLEQKRIKPKINYLTLDKKIGVIQA